MKTLKNLKLIASAVMLALTSMAFAQSVSIDKVSKVYSNVQEIEVESLFASVEIIGSDRTDVELTGEIFGTSASKDVKIKHSQSGTKLTIEVDDETFLKWGDYKGALKLLVPKNINLDIESGSGQINVTNVNDKDGDFSSGSGSIKATDYSGNGDFETGSGSISLLNISANAECNSGSGSIYVENSNGELDLETASGSIDAIKIIGKISASTASGSVAVSDVSSLTATAKIGVVSGNIKLKNFRGDVDASSVSGSINVDALTGRLRLSSVSGSIDGRGVNLTSSSYFTTVSGSIDIDIENPSDALTFELSSVSGSLRANDSKASGELIIRKGAIVIKGETVSGSQEYK